MKISLALLNDQHDEFNLPVTFQLVRDLQTKELEGCTQKADRLDMNDPEECVIAIIEATPECHFLNVTSLVAHAIQILENKDFGDDEYFDYYPNTVDMIEAYAHAIENTALLQPLAVAIFSEKSTYHRTNFDNAADLFDHFIQYLPDDVTPMKAALLI